MKSIKKILLGLSVLLCLINIMLWPVNKYEWMLVADPEMKLPIDDKVSIYPWLAMAPVSLLFIFLFFSSKKSDRILLGVTIFCLLSIGMWKYRSTIF